MIDQWAKMASRTPRLANATARFPLTAGIAKSLLHIAPQRHLPRFATSTFRSRIHRRSRAEAPHVANGAKAGTRVLLWADTFTNYFQPQIAEAAHQVLT